MRARCLHRSRVTRRPASERPAAASEPVGTEVPSDPSAASGGDEAPPSRYTHATRRCSATPLPTTGPSPHDPGHPMSPPDDRDRVGRPDGCLPCCHERRRPRCHLAPPSLPTRRPRSDPGRSRDPPASTSRACASEQPDVIPPVPLGTSSRQPTSSDPPSRTRRRHRRHDRSNGSTLHRELDPPTPAGLASRRTDPNVRSPTSLAAASPLRADTTSMKPPVAPHPPLERTRTADEPSTHEPYTTHIPVLRTARRRRRAITNALRTSVPGGGARFPARSAPPAEAARTSFARDRSVPDTSKVRPLLQPKPEEPGTSTPERVPDRSERVTHTSRSQHGIDPQRARTGARLPKSASPGAAEAVTGSATTASERLPAAAAASYSTAETTE